MAKARELGWICERATISRHERTKISATLAVEKIPGGLKVCDANGQSLAYIYSRESPNDAHMAKVLTEDEADTSRADRSFPSPLGPT